MLFSFFASVAVEKFRRQLLYSFLKSTPRKVPRGEDSVKRVSPQSDASQELLSSSSRKGQRQEGISSKRRFSRVIIKFLEERTSSRGYLLKVTLLKSYYQVPRGEDS